MRAELTTIHAMIPVVGNARDQWQARTSVRLILHAGASVGLGEASPLPGFSTETIADAREALESLAWPAHPPSSLPEIDAFCASIGPASARFAAETALLDLLARALEVPLWVLFAPEAEALPLARVLWGDELEQWLHQATEAIEDGVTTLKVKIGRPGRFDDELEQLTELRRFVGSDCRLRLDANGTLPSDHAQAMLRALAPLCPELIEEPTDFDTIMERLDPIVPLALDESLLERRRWESVLRSPKLTALVLKPTALGGLLTAWRLASKARANDLDVIVSHTLDGTIARAAAAHLALALGGPRAAGLGSHPALAPLSDGLMATWIESHQIEPPASPGLALEVGW